ncbi:hypothetical protein MAR_006343 [Mya arenaria]|uniref:Trichohyalin-plectin-homology domain-containing protein n=1 Tax=Mya arenaria TaxID=6604 RepID=A0ABY7DAR4_MYAAR|nr:hypothetical protein MAR_006343 [Mya arenaria]
MYHDTRSVYSDIHLPEKNNLVTPRPITDLGIRRALKKDGDLAKLKVPPQRLKNSIAWDTEKNDKDNFRLEKQKNHKAKVEIMREEDRQMVQLKKEKEIQEMVKWEDEHKEKQEKNWWDLNSREYDRRLQEKAEHDRKRLQAEEKRETIIHDEIQRIARENEEERLYYTKRHVVYEKKAKAKEDERMKHALKAHSKQEKQQHKRMMKMLQKTQKGIEKANDTLAKAFDSVSKQIQTEREEKEREQRKNMKKLQKDAMRWSKKVNKEIKDRESRMSMEQEKRTKIMEKTRHVAHDTRILRNKLLDRYGAENFDKKVIRVERFHSLGTRPSTQDWNTSNISLL